MGRAPCCEKQGLKKGQWTAEEDEVLVQYIKKHGHGSWRSLPKLAGLLRCGKSCRLRWTNYLRPDIKRGAFTPEEEKTIIQLHGILGNRWSSIAAQLPGRTDNEIKNLWNTHLKKRLLKMGLDPTTHAPRGPTSISTPEQSSSSETTVMRHMAQWENARLEAEVRLSKESLLFSNQTSTYNKESGSDPGLGPTPDYFLRIWKSDVGESFRRVNPNCSSSGKRSGSQISSASSSPKYGSALRTESTNTWIEETQVITNLDLGQEPGSHPSKTNIEVKEEKEDQEEEEEEEGTSLPSNELDDTTGSFTSLLVSDLLVDFPQNIGEPGGFGETQQHVWAWADIKF